MCFFPNMLIFGHMETVDMDIQTFWIPVKKLNFENLRPAFPSEGHMRTARPLFSDEKSIYGSYGAYSFRRSPHMDRTDHTFPEKALINGPSVSAISCWKV